MKWNASSSISKNLLFEIDCDELVGFYLYIFDNNKCTHDYLQDTLEIAKEFAWKKYGIPKNDWMKVDD